MNRCPGRKNGQCGLSLVEVMIGLLLSLVLTAGVIQVYLSNKQTYYLQDEMSRLQENGRFAMDILHRIIRGAGFQGGQAFVDVNTMDATNPPTPYNPANALIATSSNDHLEVIGSSWADCAGTPLPVPPLDPVPVTNFFFIDQNNNLACSSAAAAPQILIDNVETMAILYGVDANGDRTADGYRTATQVAAVGAWSNIVSVRIALVLSTSSDEARSRIVPQPMAFASVTDSPLLSAFGENAGGNPMLFDSDADGLADTNLAQDNRLHRVFTSTIALRNRIP